MENVKVTKIAILAPGLRSQIAAGEVVERPASVLKELVENSLDAGAKSVDVTLEAGGQSLIRVQDDGCGMSSEDLKLCIARHATSKLSSIEDLQCIDSYGFRGEALPSIASVSRMKICTALLREDGLGGFQHEGSQLEVNFGLALPIVPCSLPRGTVIEVRDLFESVPARLKFLKKVMTERQRCRDWLARLGLARLDVAFTLHSEGREQLSFLHHETLEERICKIWPKLVTDSLQAVSYQQGSLSLSGLAMRSDVNMPAASRLLFYVNGRSVTDKTMLAAVREAYKGKITSRDHPHCILFITMPLADVDVNVHPTKSEVRFRDEKSIFSLIYNGLRISMEEFGLPDPEAEWGDTGATRQEILEASLKEGDSKENPEPALLKADFPRRAEISAPLREDPFEQRGKPLPIPIQLPLFVPEEKLPPLESREEGNAHDLVSKSSSDYERDEDDDGVSFIAKEKKEKEKLSVETEGLEYLGQVAETYLVLRDKKGTMLILDQHAMHERILFSKIRSNAYRGHGQLFTLPLELSLHITEQERWFEVRESLLRLGFDASLAGTRLIVRAVPLLLSRSDAQTFLREVLAGREENMNSRFASLACKSAIKAGDYLSHDEAMKLVNEWLNVPDRERCPHGRPTVLRFDSLSLEHMFKRKQ